MRPVPRPAAPSAGWLPPGQRPRGDRALPAALPAAIAGALAWAAAAGWLARHLEGRAG